jgi:hypothetical protein
MSQTAQPVPVNDAATETAAWRTYDAQKFPNPADRINGFFIPIEDVNAALLNASTGVRVYLALKETGTSLQDRLHLYVVAVDANGNDILEVQGNSVVYDATMPCPNTCGQANDLNSTQ